MVLKLTSLIITNHSMDENTTRGVINSTQGFQSVNAGDSSKGTGFSDKPEGVESDRLGIKHWPRLFDYMESHAPFTAAVLSILGYIVIAAFGSMETLGQYLGYIIFLAIIGYIYNFNKKGGKYLYLLIALLLLMFGILVFQNWDTVSSYYKKVNKPFQIDTKVENIVPNPTST